MSICGKTKEYVARVDDALKNGAVPSSSATAAHTLLIEEAQDVKAEEEVGRVEESATGTATGATGSTGATGVEMMGATGLGRDGAASLRMMKNLLTKKRAVRLGEMWRNNGQCAPQSERVAPRCDGGDGSKGATGAMGNDNSTSTWIFGAKPIDDAFGLSVKDAGGKEHW